MTDLPSPTNHARSLLRQTPPPETIEWARLAVGPLARILSIEPLHGGRSHANHVIRLDTVQGMCEVVLRRWVRPDWVETDPEFSPAQEAATYALLASSAVPAPRLLAADIAAAECDVPALLLTRAQGVRPTRPTDIGSFLTQLAGALPLVHGINPDSARRTLPPYRPYYEGVELHSPAWSRRQSAWRRAIEEVAAARPDESSAFIHRDYHPGNTLWDSGNLKAIVDWSTASWGSPSVDVAHMRANLAMSFGAAAAEAFLAAYRAIVGASYIYDPYWDLRVAVDFLPDLPSDNRSSAELDRLDNFVAVSVARL